MPDEQILAWLKAKARATIGGDRLQQLAVRWAEHSVGLVERALRITALLQGGRDRGASRPAIRIKRGRGLIPKRPQQPLGLVQHIRELLFRV
jgi:hypothetical protein